MAAVETLVPDAGLGVAVLLNGTSPFYELLHKPDAIGLGAVALLMGREPAGTLEAFYPALDVALIILLTIQLRALVNLARSRNIAPIGRRAHPAARFGFGAMRVYLDVAVPLSILFVIPGWLGPWPSLLRVDIGVVLAAVFVLRVTDGLLRVRRWRQPVMDVGQSAAQTPGSGFLLWTVASRRLRDRSGGLPRRIGSSLGSSVPQSSSSRCGSGARRLTRCFVASASA